ncbi:hypothetical protein [Micromonospora sp. LOL_023]|uniref:hypothetical protein n=1 Tax=Micromonospora sp. LOL_023 TaxID=3345418 RepID=UPI003A84992A
MRPRVGSPAAAVGLPAVLVLAGCSIGEVRRTPPERTVPSVEAAVPTDAPGDVEVRPMRVPVPAYYDAPHIAFDNADHGYALFAGCTRSPAGDPVPCPPLLFVTFDGGESWQRRDHPAPYVAEHSMQVGYGSLVLSAGTDWYRSLDGGASFTRSTSPEGWMPPEFASVDGPYQVCCQPEPEAQVVEVTEHGRTPLAQQPAIPVVQTVGHLGGKLTVAGLRDGRLHVGYGVLMARLDDRGVAETGWQWQTDAITIAEPEEIRRVVVRVAPSGERWLIAERVPGEFPLVWRVNGTQLEQLPVVSPPANVVSVLPSDDSRLLVTTRDGVGAIGSDGRYEPIDWPARGASLTRLRDGTVLASRSEGGVMLGPAQLSAAGWVQVSWAPS